MMKSIIIFLVCAIIVFSMALCTKYGKAKADGSIIQKLPVGQHVISATWKDSGFCLLCRKRKAGETIDTLNVGYYDDYHDDSRIILIEQ